MKPISFYLFVMVSLSLFLAGLSGANQIEPDSLSNPSHEVFWIRINPIENVLVGENLTISGTTNLPAGQNLSVEVFVFGLSGRVKHTDFDERDWLIRTIQVQNSSPNNTWNFTVVNTSIWNDQREYTVRVQVPDSAWPSGSLPPTSMSKFILSPSLASPAETPPTTRAASSLILMPLLALGLGGIFYVGVFRNRY